MNKKETIKMLRHYDQIFNLPEGLVKSAKKFLTKNDDITFRVFYDFEDIDGIGVSRESTMRVELESYNGTFSFKGVGHK